jgi:hypothetical protein
MPTTVHRPLKIIAFNANAIGRQAYGVRKQLEDSKIDVVLFSETHLIPHMRFYIQNYDIYRTDHEDRHKGRTAVAVKRGIPHTCIDLFLLVSVEATGVWILIGNTELFLAAVYKSPQRLWRNTNITEPSGFRNKSILAGDLNAKNPVWNSTVSKPSDLKLLELFVSSNFEI